jgi:hypothetical protein
VPQGGYKGRPYTVLFAHLLRDYSTAICLLFTGYYSFVVPGQSTGAKTKATVYGPKWFSPLIALAMKG